MKKVVVERSKYNNACSIVDHGYGSITVAYTTNGWKWNEICINEDLMQMMKEMFEFYLEDK